MAYVTAVRPRDVFHVLSRDFDLVSTFCQRDVVAASFSSERNVLYARIIVKILIVFKYLLSDSDTKNGGFLDLSGSKETRECKAI